MTRWTPLTALLGTVGAVAAALTLAGPAEATEDPQGSPAASTAATTAAEQAAVVDYWTPERMATAVDVSTLVTDDVVDGEDVLRGSEAVVRATVPADRDGGRGVANRDVQTGAKWKDDGDVEDTTGKVFFTRGGLDYQCSGSSVASENESTVLTAGHCVVDAGVYSTNFVFVPAYEDGERPYGTWTAKSLLTTPQWREQRDLNYDVAFAVMNELDDETLGESVGAQDIGFNLPRGQHMHAFGYPSLAPYDGNDLVWCAGPTVPDTVLRTSDHGLGCTMTGGASGGPWFTDFDGSTGIVTSLSSFRYRLLPQYVWGPYFGDDAKKLYEQAEAD